MSSREELDNLAAKILANFNHPKNDIETFLKASGNLSEPVKARLTADLLQYLKKNPETARTFCANVRSGILGINSPLSDVANLLKDAYSGITRNVNIPTSDPMVEGSAIRGGSTAKNTSFNFDPKGSDLDTYILLGPQEFDTVYNAYIHSDPKLQKELPKLVKHLKQNGTNITPSEVTVSHLEHANNVEGCANLRQVKKEYDKGILRGKTMKKLGWITDEQITAIEAEVGRETTLSLVKKGSPFDPNKKGSPKSLVEAKQMPRSCAVKLTIGLVVVGTIIGFASAAMGIKGIISEGATVDNVFPVVSGLLQAMAGAECARQLYIWQQVSPCLGRIMGGITVADGIFNLVQGIRGGDGFRITRGAVEFVGGTCMIIGAVAPAGVLLGGLVVMDGIREIVNGDCLRGGIRTAGGALLTAAAVSAMIPGVGTLVAVGLGAAGVVTLLADMLIGLFANRPHVEMGPGPRGRAVRRSAPLEIGEKDLFVAYPDTNASANATTEELVPTVSKIEVSPENTWKKLSLTWQEGSLTWISPSNEVAKAGDWVEGGRPGQWCSGSRPGQWCAGSRPSHNS